MGEYVSKFFDTSDFPARWYCGNWSDFLGWLHIGSDLATFAAYFAIPAMLVYFARKRTDFPFTRIFWLFAAFILLCGTTHLIEAVIFWNPIYRVSGLFKLSTAVVSWATVLVTAGYLPKLLDLPSVAQHNKRLQEEIARRELVQAKLEKAREEALQANLAKSAFLANMSHEIRTPMAAILGYADLLLGDLEKSDSRQYVQTICNNGNHLLALINDILDLSRIEAGKLEIEIEKTSLPELIKDIELSMRVPAEEKRLDLVVESEGLIPETISTDATRVRQVLINVLGNAIKFTKQGRIELRTTLADGEQPSVLFEVRDTGIGIDEEQKSRLFRPFSQGDRSITRDYGGSGLGLAISRSIVRLLGGTIELSSALGEGTSVSVRIPCGPIADVPRVPLESAHLVAPKLAGSPLPEIRARVLVVDDRRDVRYVSERFLTSVGATVATAENGELGVALAVEAQLRGEPFDVIVMDMQMPVMDGHQATALLRSSGIAVPIIALTADAMKGDRERCLASGCDDYITKPLNKSEFVRLVAKYCGEIDLNALHHRRQEKIVKWNAQSGSQLL